MSNSVCLSMIVRDEAAVIERCLDSVRDSIDHFAICDTGSVDDTYEVICDWGKRAQKKGFLARNNWQDFASNRNQALQLASSYGVSWILVMDADDVFHGAIHRDGLDHAVDGYLIRYQLGNLKWTRPALIRPWRDWKYYHKVHELLLRGPNDTLDLPTLEGCWIECNVGGAYQGKEHFLKQAEILKAEKDPRSVFYLGQAYHCAGELDSAVQAFAKRTQMDGDLEERLVAWLRVGQITNDPGAFLEAAVLNTTRGEGLLGAATWCKEHDMRDVAIKLAELAVTKTNPQGMFVESDVGSRGMVLLAELLRGK